MLTTQDLEEGMQLSLPVHGKTPERVVQVLSAGEDGVKFQNKETKRVSFVQKNIWDKQYAPYVATYTVKADRLEELEQTVHLILGIVKGMMNQTKLESPGPFMS